ncbi:receptor [Branchiostoma belcheri]|nr:receptor [Branchiostoma belcheri]
MSTVDVPMEEDQGLKPAAMSTVDVLMEESNLTDFYNATLLAAIACQNLGVLRVFREANLTDFYNATLYHLYFMFVYQRPGSSVLMEESNLTDFYNATFDSLLSPGPSNETWGPSDPAPRAPPVVFAVERQVIPVVYGLICLVGMVGNILVIMVVSKSSDMKTVTNYYIVNLAITDLAFLVCCVPFVAISFALGPSWIFGAFACKAVFYIIRLPTSIFWYTLLPHNCTCSCSPGECNYN